MVQGESGFASDQRLRQASGAADEYVRGLGSPRLARPSGANQEYSFPTDCRVLTSIDLGSLSLMLGAWGSYLSGELGKEAAELDAFETVYDFRIGVAMQRLNVQLNSRKIVKDVLRALTIEADPVIAEMTDNLIARRLRVRKLEAQVKVYMDQKATLSREQSRRETDARVIT